VLEKLDANFTEENEDRSQKSVHLQKLDKNEQVVKKDAFFGGLDSIVKF